MQLQYAYMTAKFLKINARAMHYVNYKFFT